MKSGNLALAIWTGAGYNPRLVVRPDFATSSPITGTFTARQITDEDAPDYDWYHYDMDVPCGVRSDLARAFARERWIEVAGGAENLSRDAAVVLFTPRDGCARQKYRCA